MIDRADPRYATFPAEVGVPQLRWLIMEVAEEHLPPQELIASFKGLHEAIERAGRPAYVSKAEARLIWDVLWALEFYSPHREQESNPAEWNSAVEVLAEVKRVARQLKGM